MSDDKSKVMEWVDARFPATQLWEEHISKYYAPKNFNFWYFFGSLALVVLVIQIITGIWLAMSYKPDAETAFSSVEYIMRDIDYGWLIRYMHSTGASAFFIIVYLHMFRSLMYGSYKKPRELIWIFGVLIYLVMMATAFFGYLLPWGQMSYWGAQVIVNLFAAVPVIGEDLSIWVRGDYVISDVTLNRFFAFHFVLPFVLVALVLLHIIALHQVGSNNPDGIEIKATKDENGIPRDGIPFHPYYTVKDIFGTGMFLIFFSAVIFFAPEMGGLFIEHANFEPANSLKTPEHIVPVWYFTPFYAMLRAVPPSPVPSSGCSGHVCRHFGVVLSALAGSQSSAFDPLSRKLFKDRAGTPCRFVRFSGLAGSAGVNADTNTAGTDFHRALFFILPAYALVHQGRTLQTRSRESNRMNKIISVMVLAMLPMTAWGAGNIHLEEANVDVSDKASLQRGARLFVNYCLSCHSAAYQRYNRMGRDIGLTDEQVADNLMFASDKVGDTMTIAMSEDDSRRWFGNPPPDLSVIARARGADWLYTYFTTFYIDEKRPLESIMRSSPMWVCPMCCGNSKG